MIMKKLFLFVLSAFLISTNSWAKTLVPLTVCIEDDEYPIGNGYGKTSMCPPLVYIEDYTLLFEVGHPEYVLNIKDENNNVVATSKVVHAVTKGSKKYGNHKAIKLQADAEAYRITVQAKAEADAIRLKGDALRSNRELVDLTIAEKWDGSVPQTVVASGNGSSVVPLLNIGKSGSAQGN